MAHSIRPPNQTNSPANLGELADGETATYDIECPVCDQSDKAQLTVTRLDSSLRTKLWCHRCGEVSTGGRSSYAATAADALGISLAALLRDPLTALAGRLGRNRVRWNDFVEALPPEGWLRSCVSALEGSRGLQRRLWRERGLMPTTALRFGVGWDIERQAWTLPVRNDWGLLVNCTWRPSKAVPMRWRGVPCAHPMRLAGRTADDGALPLYPSVPDGQAWILVAGEWDALAARQAGLPALTGLLGCHWHDAWNEHVPGRRIAVCYDVGEEREAAVTVERLRAAGAAEAWVVPLGLGRKGADVCDFFKQERYGGYGRSAEDLLRLIKAARKDRHDHA